MASTYSQTAMKELLHVISVFWLLSFGNVKTTTTTNHRAVFYKKNIVVENLPELRSSLAIEAPLFSLPRVTTA